MDNPTTMIRPIGDWQDAGIELAFVDNGLHLSFDSGEEKVVPDQVIDLLHAILTVYIPDEITVSVSGNSGYTELEKISGIELSDKQESFAGVKNLLKSMLNDDPFGTVDITSGTTGLTATAYPPNIAMPGTLRGVDPDGMGPRVFVAEAAKIKDSLFTILVRDGSVGTGTYFNLSYSGDESCQLSLTLGNVFFMPELEQRSSQYTVQNAPVSEWQKANSDLLSDLTKNIQNAGLSRIQN